MKLFSKSRVRKYASYVISVILVAILLSYVPLSEIRQAFSNFNPHYVLVLLVLSVGYYGLKTVRFWFLLQAIGIVKSYKLVALSYMSAQPVSLLPGGEIYRSHSLRKYTGVPVKDSLAQFTMQGFLEGAAMASLAVISALALHTLRVPMLILAGLILMVTIAIGRGYIKNAGALVNKIPYINVAAETYEHLDERQKAVVSLHWLPLLYGLSILIEVCGASIAYIAVLGIGAHIDSYQAVLLYVIPVIAGFASFLPGGLGVSEQSAVGVLLLSHINVADAIAATIIMRTTIVGLGVLYGYSIGYFGNRQFNGLTKK
jgi:uncharacterized protein (TIRG00374 family)